MQMLIDFLNAIFAPFAVTPSLPLSLNPPAIYREAPIAKRHPVPLPRPFPVACSLEPLKRVIVKPGAEHDPFASVGRKCKGQRDAMLYVG